MSNYWLDKCREETVEFVTSEEPATFAFTQVDGPAISFTVENKPVMWIDKQGKIHVDPDAPAEETAKKVCKILSDIFTLSGPK